MSVESLSSAECGNTMLTESTCICSLSGAANGVLRWHSWKNHQCQESPSNGFAWESSDRSQQLLSPNKQRKEEWPQKTELQNWVEVQMKSSRFMVPVNACSQVAVWEILVRMRYKTLLQLLWIDHVDLKHILMIKTKCWQLLFDVSECFLCGFICNNGIVHQKWTYMHVKLKDLIWFWWLKSIFNNATPVVLNKTWPLVYVFMTHWAFI